MKKESKVGGKLGNLCSEMLPRKRGFVAERDRDGGSCHFCP